MREGGGGVLGETTINQREANHKNNIHYDQLYVAPKDIGLY